MVNMDRNVLFIQGGGEGGYEADARLVVSLQKELGTKYKVHYPQLSSNENVADFGWPRQIGDAVSTMEGPVILAAHSLGASMLLKYLTENTIIKQIKGIFLISTPFWNGKADWVQGLKLNEDFAGNMPPAVPVFLYHCRDDEEVPFKHLSLYQQQLPEAFIREIKSGGHQLNNDLTLVTEDIKSFFR